MSVEGNIVSVKTGSDTRLDFEQSAIVRVLNAEDKKAETKAAK